MSIIATLSSENLTVDPGGEGRCEVKVKNTGTVVQQFHLTVLGDAEEWARAEPPVLSLFPDAEGTAQIVFKPPMAPTTKPGETPFAVKVTPETEPEHAVVEEGVLTVGRYDDITAELLPLVTRGRRGTRHRVAVDSRGNAPVHITLGATDPEEDLDLRVTPQSMIIEPGRAAFLTLRAKPRKSIWRGADKSHPFKVFVGPESMATIELDGSMVQRPLLPKAAVPLAMVLVLVMLWFSLVKPTLRSAAKDAVADPIAQVEEQNKALEEKVEEQGKVIDEVAGTTTTTAAIVDPALDSTATTTTSTTSTTSTTLAGAGGAGGAGAAAAPAAGFDRRLDVVAGPGERQTAEFVIEAGKKFSVTDIIAQNFNGSAGEMRVQRKESSTAPAKDLLTTRLETFRDKDAEYHFNSPLVFTAGQRVILVVDCNSGQSACSIGLLLSGTMEG